MGQSQLINEIEKNAIPLTIDRLDLIVEAIGDAEYVLLGEASHGTSEFYTLRAELSKRLIRDKGFSFIAVEGDWPSCFRVNQYIKSYPDSDPTAQEAMQSFQRWPTWMWANRELIPLLNWMKDWNQQRNRDEQVGFYGLDVYSLWESMEEVIKYLEKTGSADVEIARKAFSCFEPYEREGQQYGVYAAFFSQNCEDEVVQLLQAMQTKKHSMKSSHEEALGAEINSLVAVNAERYYHSMVRGGPESWNIRDEHMVEALNRLVQFHGKRAKAIIWEHNTHIGDARATDMEKEGMVNVGQLLREQKGQKNVYAVGFGTYQGTVIAGNAWGAPMKSVKVPPADRGSWEDLMHRAGSFDKILFFNDASAPLFDEEIGHRAIGVVYDPRYERYGNYVPSRMAQRYDAFIYVDVTKALDPLVLEEVLV